MAEYDLLEQFRTDVIEGLRAKQKRLPSRYFYDAEGDAIFQRIMRMPEYYLTRCEDEILGQQADAVIDAIAGDAHEFDLLELGAGDGTKTKHLLRRLIALGRAPFYRPIDISRNALDALGASLRQELPTLRFRGEQREYFDVLGEPLGGDRTKAILFLGSNIGNLDWVEAAELLAGIGRTMGPRDRLMVGFDRRKDPMLVLRAYDDPAGHTRDFNLNLLRRINRELGADFDLERFVHVPVYDPFTGCASSYLVSTCLQEVHLDGVEQGFRFRAWEAIHTEISQKYDQEEIAALGAQAGLRITHSFSDRKDYFTDAVFMRA
ncbi:MAG: L-histidine N(alpha)-methyltransferase [Burkholderiales bacterium]|nr:MAG: L-histidine N(alpha)-methyltransferase [Burkholderiales bacterium]